VLFDEIAQLAEGHADLVAERITLLGERADGTARVAAERSRLTEYPPSVRTGLTHPTAGADRLAAFDRTARTVIDQSVEIGDVDTVDLSAGIVRALDQRWQLVEAHLQGNR
jgi:starvation-inducible DNA-binding protein